MCTNRRTRFECQPNLAVSGRPQPISGRWVPASTKSVRIRRIQHTMLGHRRPERLPTQRRARSCYNLVNKQSNNAFGTMRRRRRSSARTLTARMPLADLVSGHKLKLPNRSTSSQRSDFEQCSRTCRPNSPTSANSGVTSVQFGPTSATPGSNSDGRCTDRFDIAREINLPTDYGSWRPMLEHFVAAFGALLLGSRFDARSCERLTSGAGQGRKRKMADNFSEFRRAEHLSEQDPPHVTEFRGRAGKGPLS